MQTTLSGFYDGRLSPNPGRCVSVNPSPPHRSKPTIVPWSCHADGFGVWPAGYKKVIVMLIVICASESVGLGWSQEAFSCQCSGLVQGCDDTSDLMRRARKDES